jgi:hypothetical protein
VQGTSALVSRRSGPTEADAGGVDRVNPVHQGFDRVCNLVLELLEGGGRVVHAPSVRRPWPLPGSRG